MTLNELYTDTSRVSLMWMGNDGWVINLYGCVVSTDLDLFQDIRKPLPKNVDLREMAGRIRYALITHGHGDHFNEETCLFLQKYSDCRFIVPKSCCRKAVEVGLDDERVIVSTPGVPFEPEDGLHIRPTRALHGHYAGSVYRGASLGDCGYVVERNGFRLYQPGDTVLLDEHFTDFKDIDLLFFSPTEHNMLIENSTRFIQLIAPRYIFPQHYDSYDTTPDNDFWTKGYPDEVYARLPPERQSGFIKVAQGEPVTL